MVEKLDFDSEAKVSATKLGKVKVAAQLSFAAVKGGLIQDEPPDLF